MLQGLPAMQKARGSFKEFPDLLRSTSRALRLWLGGHPSSAIECVSEPPADGLTWDARWRSWARPPRAGGARPDRAGGGRRGARGDPAANPGARAPGVAGPARASAAALCRRADSGQLRVRDTSARSHERRRWAAWHGGAARLSRLSALTRLQSPDGAPAAEFLTPGTVSRPSVVGLAAGFVSGQHHSRV